MYSMKTMHSIRSCVMLPMFRVKNLLRFHTCVREECLGKINNYLTELRAYFTAISRFGVDHATTSADRVLFIVASTVDRTIRGGQRTLWHRCTHTQARTHTAFLPQANLTPDRFSYAWKVELFSIVQPIKRSCKSTTDVYTEKLFRMGKNPTRASGFPVK